MVRDFMQNQQSIASWTQGTLNPIDLDSSWTEPISIEMAELTILRSLSSWLLNLGDVRGFDPPIHVIGSGKVRSSQHIRKKCSKFNIQMCQSRFLANGVVQIMRLTFLVADFSCIFHVLPVHLVRTLQTACAKPWSSNEAEKGWISVILLWTRRTQLTRNCLPAWHTDMCFALERKTSQQRKSWLLPAHTLSGHSVHKLRHWSCTMRCPLKRDLSTRSPEFEMCIMRFWPRIVSSNGSVCSSDLSGIVGTWDTPGLFETRGTHTKANQWELRNP